MAIPTQLKHVLRRLGRAPMFTVLTLVTLAIGIGANTAIFSVVDGVLLKPLPYPQPEELVGVWHTAPGVNITDLNSAPSLYFTYREEGRTFQDVGLWTERVGERHRARRAGAGHASCASPTESSRSWASRPLVGRVVLRGRTTGAAARPPSS